MPPLETMDLEQTVVVWPWVGRDRDNELVVGEPIELNVRLTRRRSSMVNTEGVRVAVDAKMVVGRGVTEDSLVWEGQLVDLSGTGSTQPQPGSIMRVALYSESPSLRNDEDEVRREVGLVFYKGRLPSVVPTD